MNNTLPSENVELLKSLVGRRISSVRRQLFKDDMDLDEYEQNADGPVELRFDDNTVVHFIAETEIDSVGIVSGAMPRYGDSYLEAEDISYNTFWQQRVDQKISQIVILQSFDWSEDYPCEFGVEIWFNNNMKALIEYLNEENYPDMIRVAEHDDGKRCITHLVR